MPVPARLLPLLTLAVLLLGAAPAAAGGLVQLDGTVLHFTGDDLEASNVTIDLADGVLRLDDDASRLTAGPGCAVVDVDAYRVECPSLGVERIEVRLGYLGSDVRIRAALPALIQGGPGDDLIVGGPAEDAIDGGEGHDILAGGLGADLLRGGPGEDLVSYADEIAADGELLPRRGAVRVAIGRPDWSGSAPDDERDTIEGDVEQVEGGAGGDRFELRDGVATAVACGTGRDTVIADPRDASEIDCESGRVAPPLGGTRLRVPTLPFPFAGVNDRGRSAVLVEPLLPLTGGAVLLRVSCPAGLGLLELVRALPCRGRIRFARAGAEMGIKRVNVPRGGTITVRLPLVTSRALARRPGGLAITATALPDRGAVERKLTFTVKG